jgi:uncharacterized membrane protein
MVMDGWGMDGDGWLGSLLVLILVGVVVYFASREVTLRRLKHRPSTPPPPRAPAVPPPVRAEPLDILRERFARGDMTVDEFQAAKRALGYPDGPPPPTGPGATPTG